MRSFLSILVILTLTPGLQAQLNKAGYPFYQYFDSKNYQATDQNWQIAQNKAGIVYVANGESLLEYDGVNWKKWSIPNDPLVRSIYIDSNDIIYVGASGGFGYFLPAQNGTLEYHSLSGKMDNFDKKVSNIYKVYEYQKQIFFSSDKSYYISYYFESDSLRVFDLPRYTFYTFTNGEQVFGGNYLKGLFALNSDSVQWLPGGDFFASKNVFSLHFNEETIAVVTGNNGIFSYQLNQGEIKQVLDSYSQKLISDITVYDAFNSGENIALATLGKGIMMVNNKGTITERFDEHVGILDHNCLSIKQFKPGNAFWAALNVGVLSLDWESPFRYFSDESGIDGVINCIVRFKDVLYIGTDNGVYYQDFDEYNLPFFVRISGIDAQTFALAPLKLPGGKDYLLAGTYNGIYQFETKGRHLTILENTINNLLDFFDEADQLSDGAIPRFYVYSLLQSERTGDLWVANNNKVFALSYKNGKWEKNSEVFKLGDDVRYLTEDFNGSIWASTSSSGLAQLHRNPENYEMRTFNTNQGLPTNHSIKFTKFKNRFVVSSAKGIYEFDTEKELFVKSKGFPEQLTGESARISSIHNVNDSLIIVNLDKGSNSKLELLKLKGDAFVETGSYFSRFNNITVNSFYSDANLLWFSASNNLYSYQIDHAFQLDSIYHCNVRKAEGIDTVYFEGSFYKKTPRGNMPTNIQPESQLPLISYSKNDITIHFAATFYQGTNETEYSYQLEGFKQEWSKWNKEPKAVFTNLYEGQYLFKVKARNIYQIESQIGTYQFTIQPPWYKTILAYLLYFISALFLIWLIVKIYTRRLKQEKIRLEGIVRERTAEIREQRDQIAEQKQSIEDSILYASRIQRAILPSKELADVLLDDYFILFRPRDIVSGDYYWMNRIDSKIIIVAADCTGHGVPGAFMSMLGVSFLNEIVIKEQVIEPHQILNQLRERVKRTLKQEGKEGEAKDGMDIALVVIDQEKRKLYFSGAYNPVYIFRDKELIEIKADRMPIGIYIKEKESFTLNEFDYQPNDVFYIFSDGYPDQFGGVNKQKFRSKALKELLASIQDRTMVEQKEMLNNTIVEWMGDEEQVDDMVIIGVRLK